MNVPNRITLCRIILSILLLVLIIFPMEKIGIDFPEFKIANLFEDIGTLKSVQAIAMKIINDDPKLEKEKNSLLRKVVDEKFGDRIEI